MWRHVFEHKFHAVSDFVKPELIFHLLNKMKPFYEAKIPLRLGHNTDCFYQWDFCEELYELLPVQNPFIMLSRFPLSKKRRLFFSGQKNLLFKLTITPSSQCLKMKINTDKLVETAHTVHPENLYVLIGPVVKDNIQSVRGIIDRLPDGTWLDIKALTIEGIPGMTAEYLPDESDIMYLRNYAADRGFRVTDYFGCKIRERFNRPFYKAHQAGSYIREHCNQCNNAEVCYGDVDRCSIDREVRNYANTVGISFAGGCSFQENSLEYSTSTMTCRGEETYLSEMVNYCIKLKQTPGGSQGGAFCNELVDPELVDRLEYYGMLPVTPIRKLAERIAATIATSGVYGEA